MDIVHIDEMMTMMMQTLRTTAWFATKNPRPVRRPIVAGTASTSMQIYRRHGQKKSGSPILDEIGTGTSPALLLGVAHMIREAQASRSAAITLLHRCGSLLYGA